MTVSEYARQYEVCTSYAPNMVYVVWAASRGKAKYLAMKGMCSSVLKYPRAFVGEEIKKAWDLQRDAPPALLQGHAGQSDES